ncbi:MAG TPA: hypothetical protein VGL34_11965 [Steroidobacteraceae bacterium]|jgi:ribonuclease I
MFSKAMKVSMIAVLSIAVATQSAARHRRHSSDAASGEFDYYLLSLSWSPAFGPILVCRRNRSSPPAAGGERRGCAKCTCVSAGI